MNKAGNTLLRSTVGGLILLLAAGTAAAADSIEGCIEKNTSKRGGFYDDDNNSTEPPKMGDYWPAWQKCVKNWVKYATKAEADFESTAKAVGYKPEQGPLVKIEELSLQPDPTALGGTMRQVAKYVVMLPQLKDVKVVEQRFVRLKDPESGKVRELQLPDENVVATPGRRDTSGDFPVPASLPVTDVEFTYVLRVSAEGKTHEVERTFRVRKA